MNKANQQLTPEQVLKIQHLGEKFVYCIDAQGKTHLASRPFFKAILGRLGYSKADALPKSKISFEYGNGSRALLFYPIEVIKQAFEGYEPYPSSVEKNPDKYDNYFQFIELGEVDGLQSAIELQTDSDSGEWVEQQPTQETPTDPEQELHQQAIEHAKRFEFKPEAKTDFDPLPFANLEIKDEKQTAAEATPKPEQKDPNKDRLGEWLKQNSVQTYLTIFVILTFLPFTVGALVRYIPFAPTSQTTTALFWVLCVAMAAVWDMSILYFAKTGRRKMSKIGSIYQFLFFCTEFDLIARLFEDLLGADGNYWQMLIANFCIVSFSAVLVNQFTELSVEPSKQQETK